MDLLANYHFLSRISCDALLLLIREKSRLPISTGFVFTHISKLRRALYDLGSIAIHLRRDLETYVDALTDAILALLGIPDMVDHLVAKEFPERVAFFGSNLSDYDLVLLTSIWQNDTELIAFLLTNNMLNRAGKVLLVAFYLAAYRGNVELLRLVKLQGDIKVDELCGYYGNALMAAIVGDGLDAVRILIEWGADVNFLGTLFGRPLGLAAAWTRTDILQLLLEMGANVAAPDKLSQTAISVAAVKCTENPAAAKALEILKLFLDQDTGTDAFLRAKNKALVAASGLGALSAVKLLLEHGADPDGQGEEVKPIETAAEKIGNMEVVKLLVKHGATGDSLRFSTVLDTATYWKNAELVKFCIYEKGDFDPSSQDARRSLKRAINFEDVESTKLLLDNGVRLDDTQADLNKLYASIRDPAIFDMLERHGAVFDVQNLEEAFHALNITLLEKLLSQQRVQNDPEFTKDWEKLNVSSSHSHQWYPGLSAILELTELGVSLNKATVSSAIKEAVESRNIPGLQRLVTTYPGALLTNYGGGRPLYTGVFIAMILQSADEMDRAQEAKALLQQEGREIAAIAELYQTGHVQLDESYRNPRLKLWYSIEFGSLPLTKFILSCYANQLIESGHPALELVHDVTTLKEALTYFPEDKCGSISKQNWTEHAVLSATQTRNYPLVEFLMGLGVQSTQYCNCSIMPRNDYTNSRPKDHWTFNYITETMFRVLFAAAPARIMQTPEGIAEELEGGLKHSRTTTLQILKERGVDANTPIDHWGNALAFALHRGLEDIVRFLLHWGADPILSLNHLKDAEPPEKAGLWREAFFLEELIENAVAKRKTDGDKSES